LRKKNHEPEKVSLEFRFTEKESRRSYPHVLIRKKGKE